MRRSTGGRAPILAAVALGCLLPLGAQEPAGEPLGFEHEQWLRTVAPLISDEERAYFLTLREPYRRDAFIDAWWRIRDPQPGSARNELRERFEQMTRSSDAELPQGDARLLLFLFNGPPTGWTLPDGRGVARCYSRTRELEIWFYTGSERTDRRFAVVLQQRARDLPYEPWLLGGQLRPTQRSRLPTQDVRLLCADEVFPYVSSEIARITGYDRLLDQILAPPRPPAEWLQTWSGSGTDLPAGVATFEAALELAYPHRRQSRAAVLALVTVPLAQAPGRTFDGQLFHAFALTGEVIRDGKLFEAFQYRFEGPTQAGARSIPLGFTRYLRPGEVTLRLRVEDLFEKRFAQIVRTALVPAAEGLPAAPAAAGEAPAASAPSLELVPPAGGVATGMVRFTARTPGQGGDGSAEPPFDRVVFFLDDKPQITKRSPPYSVELNLGPAPQAHRVRVVGYRGETEAATDQVWLNQGAARLRVRLIEPRAGGIYPGALTARIEVETPDGKPPATVELYVNEQRIAALDQPPYVVPMRIAAGAATVVRAVARLADGAESEDAVIVNSAGLVEAVQVRLVELHVLVSDQRGEPVPDLAQSRFRVKDDGAPVAIERFAWSEDLPIRVALLVDRSSSMAPQLGQVAAAATTFAQAALRSPEDRVALLSFADQMSVDTALSPRAAEIERALAALSARGGTALYDAIAQGLGFFADLPGQNAVVLFTDGEDENSTATHEQAALAARSSAAQLYVIAPAAGFADARARRELAELAAETGGEALFLDDLAELAGGYQRILQRLRAHYLLAYPPPAGAAAGSFRRVEVEVDAPGAAVRVRRGYTVQ